MLTTMTQDFPLTNSRLQFAMEKSSETCVIQKNSLHSTVPLKSNDERADPLCPPPLPMWGRPTERQLSPNCAHSSVGWLPLRGTQLGGICFCWW